MRGIGKLVNQWLDTRRGITRIEFEISGNVLPDLDDLKDKKLDIRAYPESKKRSLSANAYYWQLLGKMAAILRISTARLHNLNLRVCGYKEVIDGQIVKVMLPDGHDDDVLERTAFHLIETSEIEVSEDGEICRVYHLLRGSHSFDKSEMSRLIDLAVEDAKEMGIETATPDELARMKELLK